MDVEGLLSTVTALVATLVWLRAYWWSDLRSFLISLAVTLVKKKTNKQQIALERFWFHKTLRNGRSLTGGEFLILPGVNFTPRTRCDFVWKFGGSQRFRCLKHLAVRILKRKFCFDKWD